MLRTLATTSLGILPKLIHWLWTEARLTDKMCNVRFRQVGPVMQLRNRSFVDHQPKCKFLNYPTIFFCFLPLNEIVCAFNPLLIDKWEPLHHNCVIFHAIIDVGVSFTWQMPTLKGFSFFCNRARVFDLSHNWSVVCVVVFLLWISMTLAEF